MAAYDRQSAGYYADSFWDTPCADGIIATSAGIVNVEQEFKKRMKGEKRSEWEARFVRNFVNPQTAKTEVEAACFVKIKDPRQKVMFRHWDGMNDCAHFVSRCLGDGGLTSVYAAGVPILEQNLRKLAITKTFGNRISYDRGKRIVASGILKPGDVIIYYTPQGTQGAHSVFYLGGGTMACHTRSRYDESWQIGSEYKVRFIHFSHDDPLPQPKLKQVLPGWWEVTYQQKKYYYYFHANGQVGYIKTKPANKHRPISVPTQRGYWFGSNSQQYTIIWSDTGSVERFRLIGSDRQQGDYNDQKNALTAEKL